MVRTTPITFVGIIIIVVAVLTIPTGSLQIATAAHLSPGTHNVQHAYKYYAYKHAENSYLPLSKFHLRGIDGPYHTQGNLILGADNRPYLFHGVARDDLEYRCAGDGQPASESRHRAMGKEAI